MAETLLKDIRYALRWMRRSPGFSAVAILSLGLGVGVNTAMFSLVDSLLFRPLPVAAPDRLVDVFTTGGDGDEYATSSYQDYLDLKTHNTVFSDMIGYSPMMAPLSLGDRSRIMLGQIVTSNYFAVLGVQPQLGRLLVPSDDDPGAERVVVLSHQMWQREFGGDQSIVGRSLTLRGLPYSIVGVSPASFTGVVPLLTPELFLPIAHVEEVEPAGINDSVPSPTGTNALERRGQRWLFVKGRLKDGVSAAQAHANVALIGQQLAKEHVQTNKDRNMAAVPTEEVRLLVPQAGGVLSAGAAGVMAIVGLVLLIACANVAGMLLARASARRREISVRLAIGASRGRLIQQLLIEGALLGTLGAVAAVALAWALIQGLQTMPLPLPISVAFDVRIDARVLTFSILVAALTGMLAGLLPALKASAPSLVSDLRGDAPATKMGGRRWTLRDALVVSQVALTAVLLVVAGLLLRSLGASQRADVGFDPKGVAAIAFDTDMVRYTPERGREFWRQAQARVAALPGVTSVGIISPTLPFTFNFNQQEVRIDNRTYAEGQRGEIIENVAVSPGYLQTMGVPVVEGRGIEASDIAGSPDVAVINATMARKFWPSESAVGHTFTVVQGTRSRTYRVVGVNRDHKRHGVLETAAPFIYYAEAQRPSRYNFIVARTAGDATALVQAMRRELLAMEPSLVFMSANTMEQNLGLSLMPARVGAMLAAGFGGLGTLLAAIGLYGVIAFSVTRRTREIGVRMALGAQPGGVLTMVMRQGLLIVAIGLAAGALLAAGAASALQRLLYGISPFDPAAWGFAIAAMLVAAALANFVPARRAMRIDPMTALRIE
ncbi:MAG TPA: ABC transporter permease [Vicinamibacterales bacterium]|nr:ABC transporter permease [Vicinamibacterales bacterium]